MGGHYHTSALVAAALLDGQKVNPRPEETEPAYVLPEGMPNRLSISTISPFFHGGISSMVGVRIDGVLVGNCYEFDVAGGWYRIYQNRTMSDMMFSGKIEPFWRVQPSRQVLKRLRRG